MYISDYKWMATKQKKGQEYFLYPISEVASFQAMEDVAAIRPYSLIVITRGDWITGPESLDEVIRILMLKRAIGMLILHRLFRELPWLEDYIEEHLDDEILITGVPEKQTFESIRGAFLDFEQALYMSRQFGEYRRRLEGLVAGPHTLLGILAFLSEHIGCSVDFARGTNFTPVTYHNSLGLLDLRTLLAEHQYDLFSQKGIYSFVKGDIIVYSMYVENTLEKPAILILHSRLPRMINSMDLLIVGETLPYIALAFNRMLLESEDAPEESADELFLNILRGKYADDTLMLRSQAVLFGLQYNEQRHLYIIRGDHREQTPILAQRTRRFLEARGVQALCAVASHYVAVALRAGDVLAAGGEEACLDKLLAHIEEDKRCRPCKISASKSGDNLLRLLDAFNTAKFAMIMGSQVEPNAKIYQYADYRAYHLICSLWGNKLLHRLYRDVMGEIERYDDENNSCLIETLENLISDGFNINRISGEMHLHRNTIYKRIERIRELMGGYYDTADEKIILYIIVTVKTITEIYDRTENRFDWNP